MELHMIIGNAMVTKNVDLARRLLQTITVDEFNEIIHEDDQQYCLLELAVLCNSEPLIKDIIAMGVDLTVMIDYDHSPMGIAVSRNLYTMLIRIGNKLTDEQMQTTTKYGNLLHCVTDETDESIYHYLLRRGLSPNTPDAKGITPLACAFALRRFDMFTFYVHYGADGSILVPYPMEQPVENTALHMLSDLKDFEEVEESVKANIYLKFCKNSSDINKRNHDGFTPIQYAILRENVFIACALLWGGANIHLALPDVDCTMREKWKVFQQHVNDLR